MYRSLALASLSLFGAARAQQVGTSQSETHPSLSWKTCTGTGGTSCTTKSGSVVLDSNWRWTHVTSGYTNCYDGNEWNTTACPDGATCAKNCAVDGADYSGTYGISTSSNALTLKFVTTGQYSANVGSRTYLMESETKYQMFNPIGKELTFDVDVSKLPCGLNGALYFVEMAADGGIGKGNNKAGAKYGTGYCDAQCPRDLKFIQGKANNVGWTGSSNDANSGKGVTGTCCSEMDIWEANSISTAYTPHPCTGTKDIACTGDACSSTCDQPGCDFNSWRMGNQTFYGPGASFTIDTTKKITVVTQFITDDNTSSGNLVDIKRFYVQNGKAFANSNSNIAGVPSTNSITDSWCAAQKTAFSDSNDFAKYGGLKKMGEAFKTGMVLTMSIWDDHAANLLWLDSDYPTTASPSQAGVNRGSCATTSGVPADLEKNSPNSKVIYSNIKTGDINSTFTNNAGAPGGGNGGGGSSSSSTSRPITISTTKVTTTTARPVTTTTTTSAKPVTTTPASGANCGAKYSQCGGQGWSGATCCQAGSTCKVSSTYYSQCL